MPYLIDGHNLIPKIPGMNLGDIDDEIQLVKKLQEFCRQRRKKVEVFFDSAPPGGIRTQKFGRVTAFFITQGSTADTAIRSRLQKLGRAAKNWTVVTSDREATIGPWLNSREFRFPSRGAEVLLIQLQFRSASR